MRVTLEYLKYKLRYCNKLQHKSRRFVLHLTQIWKYILGTYETIRPGGQISYICIKFRTVKKVLKTLETRNSNKIMQMLVIIIHFSLINPENPIMYSLLPEF